MQKDNLNMNNNINIIEGYTQQAQQGFLTKERMPALEE